MYSFVKCLKIVAWCSCLCFLSLSLQNPFLHADCGCPEPIENGGEAEMAFITPHMVYASPGQTVTATVVVTNGISPCCDAGDEWAYTNLMNLVAFVGRGWLPYVYQTGSDCRTQQWEIPVPFDNGEYTTLLGGYAHGRAGGIGIRVLNYTEPDPCKTDDMDPVNTWTGALQITDEDYVTSDVSFKRDYDHLTLAGSYLPDISDRWKNPVGFGWQHNYNIYIETIQQIWGSDTTRGCLLHMGKTISVYKKLPNGNYQPRRGNHAVLTLSGSTWKLYEPSGEIYYFDTTHNKVDSIVDRNGRKIAFTYSGNYLSKVTGHDHHTLNFTYNSDSLLRWVSMTENGDLKKFEYRYAPVVYVTHADSDTFNILGTHYLVQVLQHYPSGNADSLMSLYKYYYDNYNYLHLVAKVFPSGSYEQFDTTWTGNHKKGDRLYVWYDSLGHVIYEEVVNGDSDTLLSNDDACFRSYTKYFRNANNPTLMDSALTYIYHEDAGTGSVHDPYDESFTPEPPASEYSIRKRDYHNDGLGRKIFVKTIPDADSSYMINYCKDADFNDTLVISPDNDTTKYTYKTYTLNDTTKYSPYPVKLRYPTGDSALFYYHAPDANAPSFFLLDSTRDELARKTEYYYDNNYNLDSLRYYSRYVAGFGTTTITTDYTYNSKGNLVQIRDPQGNSTYFSYAPNDTGPYLTQTRIDFSPSGQGNEDIITKYKYNTDIGKMDTVIYFKDYPGDSSVVYYTYDVMNQLKETYYPDEVKDVLTYDKRGNLITRDTYKDKTCHFKIGYEYDAFDHLVKVKEYKNASQSSYDSTLYKFNLSGELVSFINANDTTGISTEIEYTYDAGRLIRAEYPDTTTDSLGYYKDGNLKFKRDRQGKVTAYAYDKRDRLTKKRYFISFAAYQGFPDSVPAETLAFFYNKVGNMVSMTDKNGTVRYSYDDVDGLDTLNCYQNILITYEYDQTANKKRLKVVNASDTTIVYINQSYPSYDEAKRLLKTAVGTDTFSFTYWDTGPLKKLHYPNGVEEQYALTSRNAIDVVTDSCERTQLFKYDYAYNELGDRDSLGFYVTRFGQSPLSGIIAYSYDDLRRLTQAQYPQSIYTKTNTYSYDKTGNRLRKIAGSDTTSYTYNKRNNQLMSEGGNMYVYDDNGNVTEVHPVIEQDYYHYWDFENRLLKVKKTFAGKADSLTFLYSGMGKRIKKIHGVSDTTGYAYDGIYVICEFGGHLDLSAKYVYANGMLLARYDASPADTHYYHHDGLGSIIGMTNENGWVEQSYFYDEFGILLGSWGTTSNHYLYTGQEYDSEMSGTELYNLRARYYTPEIGRFISEDPMGFHIAQPQMQNLYPYVENNATNWRDITGLFTKCQTITSIPGLWYDIGKPIHVTTCWDLIHAKLRQPAAWTPQARMGVLMFVVECAFQELWLYKMRQARIWYILQFCVIIERCRFNVFFKTDTDTELGYSALRTKILRKKYFSKGYLTPVVPAIECWNLLREEEP